MAMIVRGENEVGNLSDMLWWSDFNPFVMGTLKGQQLLRNRIIQDAVVVRWNNGNVYLF